MLNILDYQDLPVGTTRNTACPVCGKRKFYVTRKPLGYAYICFRESCDMKPGFLDYITAPAIPKAAPQQQSGRTYRGALYKAEPRDIDYFEERFGILLDTDPSYWVKVAQDGRYAFPVHGPRDESRGVVLRRPLWKGQPSPPRRDCFDADFPKSINYFKAGAIPCGWYHSADMLTVVIVEDPVSAMRVAGLGVTAVALYGTNLQDSVIQDLVKFKAENYVIALDPDATGKALKMLTRLMSRVPHSRVAILKRDPKDYELDSWLEEDLGL